MVVWLDAHLPPGLALWLSDLFAVEVHPVRDVSLHHAEDAVIFEAARKAGAVVVTKDSDFVALLERLGPPPQVVWLTCGNTSRKALQEILGRSWPRAMTMLEAGEPLVEIGGLVG